MDSYTIYEDLSIRWDKNPPAANAGKVLYHVEAEPTKIDQFLGASQSPHVYRIFDANKKPSEIRLGNFYVEGSVLTEQEQGIYRVLKFFILDASGDKEERSITFSGAHDGGLVRKIPAIMNELKDLQQYGTWKGKTTVTVLKAEIEKLKAQNQELETKVLEYEARIIGLQNQVRELQFNLPPSNPELLS